MKCRCFSFRSFVLIPNRQVLLKDDSPVRLGIRALDILTIFVQRPGEIINKEELISLVWPDTFVDESNLKVNIASLRKALDEEGALPSCIATVIGRGYRFLEPVQVHEESSLVEPSPPPRNMTGCLKPLVGREEAIAQLTARMERHRLVTIVGAPGVGKTAVATAVADALTKHYEGRIYLADLHRLSEPDQTTHAIAGALGLWSPTKDKFELLTSYFAHREALLLIDTCEVVIDAVAAFVERIQASCPSLRILAISREPLRAKGERVYRLPGLSVPPPGVPLDANELQKYPAVQLFLEEATETAEEYHISKAEAAMIGELCRKLNGVPLALELAAMCFRSLGFDGLPSVTSEEFFLFNQGQRTGPARHQSLAASIDWSFRLLTEKERRVLSRLARLECCFDLQRGIAVAADEELDRAEATTCIANLVSKSLVERLGQCDSNFRLLHSIRFYALQKLSTSEERERDTVHREYFAKATWKSRPSEEKASKLRALTAIAS